MKKTALLIDGGWFAKGLGDILKGVDMRIGMDVATLALKHR